MQSRLSLVKATAQELHVHRNLTNYAAAVISERHHFRCVYQETRTTATRLTVAKTNELGFAYEERMHRRTKVIIISAIALSGLLASISFFRAARSDEVEGVQSNDADADQLSTIQTTNWFLVFCSHNLLARNSPSHHRKTCRGF